MGIDRKDRGQVALGHEEVGWGEFFFFYFQVKMQDFIVEKNILTDTYAQ